MSIDVIAALIILMIVAIYLFNLSNEDYYE